MIFVMSFFTNIYQFTLQKGSTAVTVKRFIVHLQSGTLIIIKPRTNRHHQFKITNIQRTLVIFTGCSKLVRVMKRRKSSPADEIEVVLLSVSVRI